MISSGGGPWCRRRGRGTPRALFVVQPVEGVGARAARCAGAWAWPASRRVYTGWAYRNPHGRRLEARRAAPICRGRTRSKATKVRHAVDVHPVAAACLCGLAADSRAGVRAAAAMAARRAAGGLVAADADGTAGTAHPPPAAVRPAGLDGAAADGPVLVAVRADAAARRAVAAAVGWRPSGGRCPHWLAPASAAAVPALAGAAHAVGPGERAAHRRRWCAWTCRSRSCRRRCTAFPSRRSATCMSARPSSAATCRPSSSASMGCRPTWWRSPATWSTARCRNWPHHVAPLAGLSSRHGTFFVTGNHEYYSGAHAWVDELRRLGLRVLMNEHVRAAARRRRAGAGWRGRLQRSPFRRVAPQRPAGRHGRRARRSAGARAAGAPAAQRRGGGRRPASTCRSPATPTAASSCRGTCSCACSSLSPPD